MFPYICAKMVKASFLLYVWAKVLSGVECASLKVQNTIFFGKMLCMYMFKYRVQIHRELSFYLVLHELGRFGKRSQGLGLKIQSANHWSELAKSYICCSERNIITLPRSPTPWWKIKSCHHFRSIGTVAESQIELHNRLDGAVRFILHEHCWSFFLKTPYTVSFRQLFQWQLQVLQLKLVDKYHYKLSPFFWVQLWLLQSRSCFWWRTVYPH